MIAFLHFLRKIRRHESIFVNFKYCLVHNVDQKFYRMLVFGIWKALSEDQHQLHVDYWWKSDLSNWIFFSVNKSKKKKRLGVTSDAPSTLWIGNLYQNECTNRQINPYLILFR